MPPNVSRIRCDNKTALQSYVTQVICILHNFVYLCICKSERYLIFRKSNAGSFDQCAQWFLPHAGFQAGPGRFSIHIKCPLLKAFINRIFCFYFVYFYRIQDFKLCHKRFLFTQNAPFWRDFINLIFAFNIPFFLIFSFSEPDNPFPFWKSINYN